MKKSIYMGVSLIGLMLMATTLFSQSKKTAYDLAMEAYRAKNYAMAASQFKAHLHEQGKEKLSNTELYNGVCILALQGEVVPAFELLQYLTDNRFYSNYDHVSTDADLESLHSSTKWQILLNQIDQNKKTLAERTKQRAKNQLLKAKALLEQDNGKSWGENIWTENIIVLGPDNTVYALYPMAGSTTTDSVLYTKTIANNVLSQTNTAQQFDGKRHAIVLTSYLSDSSATIIHELFHVLQSKKANFAGDPVPYLDKHDARELLRLEYAALRQAFESIIAGKKMTEVDQHAKDALLFRKIRQQKYAAYLDKELQIETLEGLANYTGYALSSWSNKYEKAIKEINSREKAETYTRPFPYATGLAYGLLFDYLKLSWKQDPWQLYNFLTLYEKNKGVLATDERSLERARTRNGYATIHEQEVKRKEENDKMIAFYTESLVTQPVLRAELKLNTKYSMSFNMNGTMALEGKGIVYSSIDGFDASGKNFGNFKTIAGKDNLGQGGILCSEDRKQLTFPKPLSIDGKVIKGECYEIELAEGWEVVKVNEKGDLQIIQRQ